MPHRATVRDLYESLRERLQLRWLACRSGGQRSLLERGEEHKSRLIAGRLNLIHPNRIQLIGRVECDYLDGLEPAHREGVMVQLFAADPAAVLISNGIEAATGLIEAAERAGVPLLWSPLDDTQVLDNIQYFGSLFLSDKIMLHGVYMEVLGMGVLITGDSAVGKSELALELIARGCRLVADDAAEFSRIAPDIVSGACPKLLREFLEVRGLGILNIRAMFGDNAIKESKYLRLIVHLERMRANQIAAMDRLFSAGKVRDVLGVAVSEVTIPVAPGRNLAILVETAVRNHLLKLKGYDATEDFIARQRRAINEAGKA